MRIARRAVQLRVAESAGGASDPKIARSLQWIISLALLSFLAAMPAGTRVVVLVERGPSIYLQARRGFEQGFAGSGQVDLKFVDGDVRELHAIVEELRKDPPQLVVAFGTQAAIAAKSRLHDVPIVYCLALNPVKNDLVGANVGGVRLEVDFAQQFSDLEKLVPHLRRLGVIYSEPVSGRLVRQARTELKPGVELIARDARDARHAAQFIEEIMGQVDAFWLPWDAVIANVPNFRLLVDLSLKNKVALIAPAPPFVEAGALMSVSADYEKAGQRASEMARIVLAGGRAGDFPAEPPPARLITINASVARTLGISIPPTLHAEILSPGVAPVQAPGGSTR
jgi:putative tryptophan/tyrosine transport system substrate-binding protein